MTGRAAVAVAGVAVLALILAGLVGAVLGRAVDGVRWDRVEEVGG